MREPSPGASSEGGATHLRRFGGRFLVVLGGLGVAASCFSMANIVAVVFGLVDDSIDGPQYIATVIYGVGGVIFMVSGRRIQRGSDLK